MVRWITSGGRSKGEHFHSSGNFYSYYNHILELLPPPYSTLSGMTGTAKTDEEEFLDTFNMEVVSIPTNKQLPVPICQIWSLDQRKPSLKHMLKR